MTGILVCLAALLAGGALAFASSSERGARFWGVTATLVAAGYGLAEAFRVLTGAPVSTWDLPWELVTGPARLRLDALSAFFTVPILGLAALAAVFGSSYLAPVGAGRRPGTHWFHYCLLTASMLGVVLADDGLLFLLSWEVMALSSFFLVAHEREEAAVREAAWTYLVAAHLGAACLLALFALLGREAGSLDFARWRALGTLPATTASAAFLLALIGFGTKAGLVPLHVWLPQAHPAAPSHVSALMSGVMIKTGIYGLARTLEFLHPWPLWWAWVLILVGAASALAGVLYALTQHDLKCLLAYHSVENIGIIVMGLGLGVLGATRGQPAVAAAGFAGALLHVVNHATFKGLLFLAAGSVAKATGTRDLEQMGGLLRRMPWTGASFLVGTVAISALPPLNGFASEFLVYLSAYRALAAGHGGQGTVPALAVIAAMALTGGLAAACFAKAFGVAFLGLPRSEEAGRAHEATGAMTLPGAVLALVCVAAGFGAPVLVGLLGPAIQSIVAGTGIRAADGLALCVQPLSAVASVGWVLVSLSVLLGLAVRLLLSRRTVGSAPTWGCGYACPTPRMQYTASSFAQPLTRGFGAFLGLRRHFEPPAGLFPARSSFESHMADPWLARVYEPLFAALGRGLQAVHRLQHGRLQLYIVYIAATLLGLLVWRLVVVR